VKVLAIGAHPDDIELGCGGTMYKHVQLKDEVAFLVLTNGEKTGKAEIKRKATEESAKSLGVSKVYMSGLPDTKVKDGIKTITIIESVVKNWKPHRVYTHCVKDVHQDHRNAAKASISACRNVPQVLSYQITETLPSFSPQFFVDITECMLRKTVALRCFKSQSLEYEAVKAFAQFRGFQAHLKRFAYAEAFEVVRFVE